MLLALLILLAFLIIGIIVIIVPEYFMQVIYNARRYVYQKAMNKSNSDIEKLPLTKVTRRVGLDTNIPLGVVRIIGVMFLFVVATLLCGLFFAVNGA